MPTPTGAISLSDVATELGVSASGLSLNDASVRRLAEKISGAISLNDLRGKYWNQNIINFHGPGYCYSGQAGFALDKINGDFILTMGAWPTDPPNCQTCDSSWLINQAAVNTTRRNNNSRPYWTNTWTLNISNIAVGAQVTTRAPNWPYTNVSYTYIVTRTGATSLTIDRHPKFGTGDTGTSISVSGWGDSFNSLAGTRSANGWSITVNSYGD
jgi:hypothetical protein